MSPWKRTFEKQQVVQLVKVILQAINDGKAEGLAPTDHELLARLIKALHAIELRCSSLDPDLYHRDTWGNFNGWLTSIASEVKTFWSDKNVAHLQNANNSIDEVLAVLRPIDIGSPEEHVKAASQAADAFQRKLIEDLEATRKRADDFQARLDALQKEIDASKAKLAANDQTIEQQKGRLDQSIAEFQKQFSQAESTRASEFTAALQKAVAEWSAQQKKIEGDAVTGKTKRESEFDKFLTDSKKQNDEMMSFFQKRQKEVDAIFGAIGAASFSGHFGNTADRDASAANWLRRGALALMCGMVIIGGISFYQSLIHPEIDWKVFLFRLATVFVVAIPAVYAAQESSKHRERERHNRKIHLELAAIDAYLVALPEAKRNELKEKLTEKFFGTPDTQPSSKDETNHALLEILKDAMKNLTKSK